MNIGKLTAGAALLVLSSPSFAALVARDLDGNLSTIEAVYDSDQDISWLANANLATTSTFGVLGIDPSGRMTQLQAQQWVGALNTNAYLGLTDWRLPTALTPDDTCSSPGAQSQGYNCTGSEMGSLFYEGLGGTQAVSIANSNNGDLDLFSNVQLVGLPCGSNCTYPPSYWTSTLYPGFPTYAYTFDFNAGFQNAAHVSAGGDGSSKYAWAVHDGVVGAPIAPVPLPAAGWLMLSGLGLLATRVRRK